MQYQQIIVLCIVSTHVSNLYRKCRNIGDTLKFGYLVIEHQIAKLKKI